MRHLCCVRVVALFFLLLSSLSASLESKSAIVYYGEDIPYTLAGIHDYIIVQPGHTNTYRHGFKLYDKKIYAYVSIGESQKEQPYYKELSKEWFLGDNKLWQAKVMDISNEQYHEFLFRKVIDPLMKKGFQNFFFDTLDSYHLVTKTPKEKKKMSQGVVKFIKEFHTRYPKSKLIINRGFDIIGEIHEDIEAVLFESLFYGLSSKDLSYTEVSSEDRKWLKMQIEKVKSYNIPLIAVDYLPPESKKIAKNIQDIEALDLIPYIADRDLHRIGKSSKNATKREVLLLYDDTQFDGTPHDDEVYSTAFLQLSMPLEYMGYIPILKPISTWKPTAIDADRYAGAIVWINGEYALKNPQKFQEKLLAIYRNKIKMLLLESLDSQKHQKLFQTLQIDVKQIESSSKESKQITCKNGFTGFEIEPFVPASSELYRAKNSTPICTLKIGEQKSLIAAITPWGGYGLEGVLTMNINEQDMWIANPFKLMRETLRLPHIPIPDVTTENGRRLLFVHIDGDGIMNRAEWDPEKFSGGVLFEEIFTKYNIPISFSIIEAETAPYGLYPEIHKKLEKIAQKIYRLPNIEPATHTFTHPFFWQKIVNDSLKPEYRLAVKDYNFSVNREINGSLSYINSKLTPKGKSSKMTFWSGDCLPKKEALEYMYKNNFLQMNGGDTTITNRTPWLSCVAPLGLKRGDYYQIYTGAQNENVFTNDWIGPFWGFKRVIQTFKLTDAPRRLKPIDIYFHIYSGSKRAALNALHTVFDWAIEQSVMPIYTSAYIPKVMDFYEIAIAKERGGEDKWLIAGTQSLHTIRTTDKEFVDINHSIGVMGMKKHLDARYLHLDSHHRHIVTLKHKALEQNYLLDANSRVDSYSRDGNSSKLHFVGEVPVEIRYHLLEGCQLDAKPKATHRSKKRSIVELQYEKAKDIHVTLSCP